MKITIVLALLVICATTSTMAQLQQITSPESYVPPDQTIAAQISTIVVEAISRGFRFIFELFDIKVRTVRFLASLYTTDNLVLLKKVMHIALRFGNWLYDAIPNSTAEGPSQFLSSLFPQVNFMGQDEEGHPVNVESDQATQENHYEDDTYENVMNLDRLIRPRSY